MGKRVPLPRNEYGEIQCSAEYGESFIAQVIWTTDFDGRPIDRDKEDFPSTYHGPFYSRDEANQWVYAYPEFEDIEDILVLNMNSVRPNQRNEIWTTMRSSATSALELLSRSALRTLTTSIISSLTTCHSKKMSAIGRSGR